MKKESGDWTIRKLLKDYRKINFPEYQREPSVWGLPKKQRLIDSILRGFDIANIYFFVNDEGTYDCIDGRQRINAILSFAGKNDLYGAQDNKFKYRWSNEIYEDRDRFQSIEDKGFDDPDFTKWREAFSSYRLSVVEISEVDNPEELNLLFLRLQLGEVLNSGEKLHAMTGEMRDYIFDSFGQMPFFEATKIPYRRFAREQTAAQIAINVIHRQKDGDFARSRYLDLQLFLKEYKTIPAEYKRITASMIETARMLESKHRDAVVLLRNRAMVVSVFLYAHQLRTTGGGDKVTEFVRFFPEFLSRLQWQIGLEEGISPEYLDLQLFQSAMTQASVEKSATKARHDLLEVYFQEYEKSHTIKGDKAYQRRTGRSPAAASRESSG